MSILVLKKQKQQQKQQQQKVTPAQFKFRFKSIVDMLQYLQFYWPACSEANPGISVS